MGNRVMNPESNSTRWFRLGLPVLLVIWVVLWICPILVSGLHFVYPAFDLGIYAEALHRISHGDLNPFLDTRGLRIFADHFDPVILPVALLTRGSDPALAAIAIEGGFFLASALVLYIMALRGTLSPATAWLAICYLLFNLATQNATGFPVHPTAWSVLPLVLLAVGRTKAMPKLTFFSMALLLACKEEFVFSAFLVGVYLLLRRETRLGWATLMLATAWGGFVFGLRDLVFGHSMDYGGGLLREALHHPFRTLWASLSTGKAVTVIVATFLPVLLLVFLARTREGAPVKSSRDLVWFWCLLLLPMVAIRLLSPGHWQHHYSVPLAAVSAGFLVEWSVGRYWPRWVLWAIPLLLLLTSAEGLVRRVRMDTPFLRHLSTAQRGERRAALEAARGFLLEHREGSVVAQQNLVPRILARRQVFLLSPLKTGRWADVAITPREGGAWVIDGTMVRSPEAGFRYLWLEKPPAGDPDPVTHEEIASILKRLRALSNVVWHRDDAYQFLVEGNFQWKQGR